MVCILRLNFRFKFQFNLSMKLLISCLILVIYFEFTLAVCPPLSPPIGGVFVKECTNTVGTICVIKCTIDKRIHKRKCLEDGTWTGGVIQCHRKKTKLYLIKLVGFLLIYISCYCFRPN